MAVCAASVAVSVSGSAWAQATGNDIATEELQKKALTKTSTTVPDGWKVTAKVGGTFNVTDARNVVGAVEGTAIQLGATIGVNADYKYNQHTWENSLSIQEAFTRTPPPDDDTPSPLVKSLDTLDLLSTYIYRFNDPDWLGPFVQLKLNTQVFATSVEPVDPVTVIRNGDEANQQAGVTQVDVTEPFEPLLLRQTAGLFGRPYESDEFTLDFKIGIGAQEVIARGGAVLEANTGETADNGEAIYRLQDIEDTFDLGLEGSVAGKGILIKDVLTWNASFVAFVPFVTVGDVPKVDDNGVPVVEGEGEDATPVFLDTFERVALEFNGALSLKLTKYVSVDYTLLVRRFPQIRDAFQVQNALQVTLTMDLL